MKLVEIHWVDSMGASGWRSPDDMNLVDMTVQTFGWLVTETENSYVVSAHRCIENDDVHAPMKIPKCAVRGLWVITLPDMKK